MTQLAIDGTPLTMTAETKLTERQRYALDLIGRLQPMASDELGAHLCERRGKHPAGARCEWCGAGGKEVGRALANKGLVRRTRAGWVLHGYQAPQPPSSQGSEIPY